MNNNYITLKQLAALANELKISVDLLESKLNEVGIVVKNNCGCFHTSYKRRHTLELY